MRRPQLRPGLRQVWRDPTTLQLGLTSAHGALVTGLQDGDDALLAAMDGVHDVAALHRLARARCISPARVDDLVRLLQTAGVLVDGPGRAADRADRVQLGRLAAGRRERLAPDADAWGLVYDAGDGYAVLAERTRRHVHVDGAGRLAGTLVATLAEAGVRTTASSGARSAGAGSDAGSDGCGKGGNRRPRSRPSERTRPDLAVLVRDDVVDVQEADDLTATDQPHLAVVQGVDRVVVGPLVLPGTGPCLRCLDLHRRDRDPRWPYVAAQLAARRPDVRRGECASAVQAAGLAALQALIYLDGHAVPLALGRTLDVVLPDGLVERRRWPAHAACGCARLPDPRPADAMSTALTTPPPPSRASGAPMHRRSR